MRQTASPRWPLTEAQTGLWYAQQLDPTNPSFNVAHAFYLRGALDVAAFTHAVNQAAKEAGALHLCFAEADKGVVQWLDAERTPWLEKIDLQHSADPQATLATRMQQDRQTPVNPARQALSCNRLFQLGDENFVWYQRVHHLATDGYGMDLFAKRVAALYRAATTDEAAGKPLPEFERVINADADYRNSPKQQKHRDWWQALFADAPDVVGMAAGRAISAHDCHRIESELPAVSAKSLNTFSQQNRFTWPDVLTALVALYCQRMTARQDAVIGVPFMGRFGNPAAGVPAMLMNVLAVPLALDETQPLLAICQQAAKSLGRARRRGRYRSEQLRRDLGLLGGERRLHGALVNVLPFDDEPDFGALDVTTQVLATGPVDDITFTFRGDLQNGGAVTLEVEANPDLYSHQQASAHAERLAAFIHNALTQPTLAQVPTATPAEIAEQQRLAQGERHQLDATSLTHLLETVMQQCPQREAVCFDGQSLSYAELDARTAALASQLIEQGVGADDLVAVCLPRSLALIIALVAILRAGGAYLPLDPEHPAERSRSLIERANAKCLLADDKGRNKLAATVPCITPTNDDEILRLRSAPRRMTEGNARPTCHSAQEAAPPTCHSAQEAASPTCHSAQEASSPICHSAQESASERRRRTSKTKAPLPKITGNQAAYVIYTSGSTGKPKGVLVQHNAIVNRLLWMQQHYGINADDRILQKTPVTFDVSVWELFLPLISGACLVIAKPGEHRDPTALAQRIRQDGVTTLHFVPSMLAAFLAEPAANDLPVKRVFCSGEALGADQRDKFHQLIDAELHNLYGPTEAAVDVSYWPASVTDTSLPVPIGFPVWNTALHILDDNLHPVPAGVLGHLYLGGVQLARGYLGQPELTAERFITDPADSTQRLYRSGDIALRRDDGAVVYLGREDAQVKIRGLRIEPGEIEGVICASGLVSDCVVLPREDGGVTRLIAYLIPSDHYDETALRQRMARDLPDYMLPAAFITLAAFPVTHNGKLDRRALPAPNFAETAGRPGATETEKRLCRLYQDILSLPELPSAEADFFQLGGDSLLAVALIQQLRDDTDSDPGLGQLFANPSVEALAAVMDSQHSERNEGLAPLLKLAGGNPGAAPLFCIHPAGGIAWCYRELAHQLAPSRPVYGLQSPALDVTAPSPASIDELAQHYVQRIREVQPHGPYHLLGWSLGGIIAQAMAVALQQLGEPVGLLAALDAYPSDCWRNEPDPGEAGALRALLAIAGFDPEQHPELNTRQTIVNFLRDSGSALGQLPDNVLDGVVRVVTDTNRLVRNHHHRHYNGTLTHIRAALDHENGKLKPSDWGDYIGKLNTVDLPFRHGELTGKTAVKQMLPALIRSLGSGD